MPGPAFLPLGDAALSVSTPLAHELRADLEARPLAGVREAVPALHVLTVLYDPLVLDAAALEAGLRARLADLRPGGAAASRRLALPVAFGGPDLAWCAGRAGLGEAALVAALCACELEVAFLGFTPGFAFLTGLPTALQMPRLDAPRERVPAGAVALGGPWAGVYPRETPGGWRIVGHTNLQLFDPARPDPVWWRPGDRVRLEATGA